MISVSILGIKKDKLVNYVRLDHTSCDFVHIDIMDNKFVPNTSEYEVNYHFNKPIDVHLMVEDVDTYIDKYKKLKPSYITFHLEVKKDINKLIKKLKNLNIKVGLAIKPDTDVEKLIPYLDRVDLVLIMSVEPGFGGQEFMEKTTERVNRIAKIRKDYKYNFIIEVDGGINDKTITKVKKADLIVCGNYITSNLDYQKNIKKLKDLDN